MKKFESFDIEDPFGEESKPKEEKWSNKKPMLIPGYPPPPPPMPLPGLQRPERRPYRRPERPPLELYNYNTTMTIGNPINHPVHRNKFKITVKCMHGDADAYTSKTIYEEARDIVIKIYDFLKWARRADSDLYNRMWNLAFPNNEDGLFDILSRDATSNGEFWASPDRVTITYFDDNGVEHNVNFN